MMKSLESYLALFSPIDAGKRRKALEKRIVFNGHEMNVHTMLELMFSNGFRPEAKRVRDTAKEKKLTQEMEAMAGRFPLGNPKHPESIRFFTLRDQLNAGCFREDWRIVGADSLYTQSDLGKIPFDYFMWFFADNKGILP